MMVGLCQPDEGVITFLGESVTNLPMYKRARRGIGYLPQESSVFRRLSVEHNVLAILEMLGYARKERSKRVDALLEELDLIHIRKSMAYALSGGERRRLEITRALAATPSFMLLDEPFAGIDPIAVADIQQIITRLKGKGIGILITDHNVQETLSIVDRAYIINEGLIWKRDLRKLLCRVPQPGPSILANSSSCRRATEALMKLRLVPQLSQKLIMTPYNCSKRLSCCSCLDLNCNRASRSISWKTLCWMKFNPMSTKTSPWPMRRRLKPSSTGRTGSV